MAEVVVTGSVVCMICVGVDVWGLGVVAGLCWTLLPAPPIPAVAIPAVCAACHIMLGAELGLVSVTMVCDCKKTCLKYYKLGINCCYI